MGIWSSENGNKFRIAGSQEEGEPRDSSTGSRFLTCSHQKLAENLVEDKQQAGGWTVVEMQSRRG